MNKSTFSKSDVFDEEVIFCLEHQMIPAWKRYGMDHLAVAAGTLREFHDQPLPEQMRTWKKKRTGKRVVKRQEVHGASGVVETWPEDDQHIWWANFPPEVLSDAYSALDKTGWNSHWMFVPYWDQKVLSLPTGVNASIYQSPDGNKEVLVVMNTSGKEQKIDLPLTLGKSTFSTMRAIYPQKSTSLNKEENITLQIPSDNFQMVVLEK